mgnify:CR=1 FL=1
MNKIKRRSLNFFHFAGQKHRTQGRMKVLDADFLNQDYYIDEYYGNLNFEPPSSIPPPEVFCCDWLNNQ